ncbi:MAG: tRNA pseudouridine(38-40) synthase TruA [Euryarchaeota archaeon]|nr:tRNA pseudouridine(38-40) synthase TruA [Euryarchaeota archaeon]
MEASVGECVRYAAKLAYQGSAFHGSQRQPHARTVEGDLLESLGAVGAIDSAEAAHFAFAGRTDRGVSALGNVAAFDTGFRRDELLSAINANMRDAWVWAIAERPSAFNPRHAKARTYKYILDERALSPARSERSKAAAETLSTAFNDALQVFVGEHDFTSFARIEPGVNPVRRIDSINAVPRSGFVEATFVGESFLWHQVRRIVEAARRVAAGDIPLKTVELALSREREADLGISPPDGLILMDVAYDFSFTTDERAARGAREEIQRRLAAATLSGRVFEEIGAF